MADAKLLLGEAPPAPTPARLFTRNGGAVAAWGHLLPLTERRMASTTLRCLRNALPHTVILRILQHAVVDAAPLEATLAIVDQAIRAEVPAQEGPPTGSRPCQSRWWSQYRRAVVDSLHGLAEKCDLELVIAHHAAKLVDLIWLLPHARNDADAWTAKTLRSRAADAWTAKTLRSRAAYLCVGALTVAADAHAVEAPSSNLLEKAVPDLFAQQCRQSNAKACEAYIRRHLSWRTIAPTPLHFLRIYVAKRPLYTAGPPDYHQNQPVTVADDTRVERLFLYVQKWCCFFCSMCLQHREFSGDHIESAKLGAAVLLVARRNLKLTPEWRPELTAMTSFSFEEVAPVADRIFEVYEDEFREFQREHEARAQAGGAAGAAAEDEDDVDLVLVATAQSAVAAPSDEAAVRIIWAVAPQEDEVAAQEENRVVRPPHRAAARAAVYALLLGRPSEEGIRRIACLVTAFEMDDPALAARVERYTQQLRK